MRKFLTTDEYVANILATYDQASPEQRRDGAEWYPAMARIMREHAAKSGFTVEQCAAIYAATSINTSWSINLSLAARALADGGLYSGTLGMVCDKVNAILDRGHGPNMIDRILTSDDKRLKLRNFWRNLSGDMGRVTVDRWARRIATGDMASKSVPQGEEYLRIAAAYSIAAEARNVDPATMQAVTWCVVRGDGQ